MLLAVGSTFLLVLGTAAYYFGVYLSLRWKEEQGVSSEGKPRLTYDIIVKSAPGLLESVAVLFLLFGVILEETPSDQTKLIEEIITIVVLQIRSGRAFEEPGFFSAGSRQRRAVGAAS